MNINIRIILSVILLAVVSRSPVCASTQEITEENYLKADGEIWRQSEDDMKIIFDLYKKYPGAKDSLMAVARHIEERANEKNVETAVKYALVPSGLKRLFMVRLHIPKDRLLAVYKGLPDEMQASQYGKSILLHVVSEQVEEGGEYRDFKAIGRDGADFSMSSLTGNDILFLYGGLDCMGKEGRAYLDKLHRERSKDGLKIIVYCDVPDLEILKKTSVDYSCDFILVADFKGDFSPVKILYGAQARPTCFFVNKQGIVKMKTVGLDETRINRLLHDAR